MFGLLFLLGVFERISAFIVSKSGIYALVFAADLFDLVPRNRGVHAFC